MSLLNFLKPDSGSLSTAEQTGLPENVRSDNHAVQNMMEKEPTGGHRKYTTTFTAEDRTEVGKYAAKTTIFKPQITLKLNKTQLFNPAFIYILCHSRLPNYNVHTPR